MEQAQEPGTMRKRKMEVIDVPSVTREICNNERLVHFLYEGATGVFQNLCQ